MSVFIACTPGLTAHRHTHSRSVWVIQDWFSTGFAHEQWQTSLTKEGSSRATGMACFPLFVNIKIACLWSAAKNSLAAGMEMTPDSFEIEEYRFAHQIRLFVSQVHYVLLPEVTAIGCIWRQDTELACTLVWYSLMFPEARNFQAHVCWQLVPLCLMRKQDWKESLSIILPSKCWCRPSCTCSELMSVFLYINDSK